MLSLVVIAQGSIIHPSLCHCNLIQVPPKLAADRKREEKLLIKKFCGQDWKWYVLVPTVYYWPEYKPMTQIMLENIYGKKMCGYWLIKVWWFFFLFFVFCRGGRIKWYFNFFAIFGKFLTKWVLKGVKTMPFSHFLIQYWPIISEFLIWKRGTG